MSCCGQKREAFRHESETSSRARAQDFTSFEPEPEKPPKVFEYTGDDNLILRGISSGAVYHFRFKGEKLTVDFYDSSAMMGERDLKIA
ncbi:MAG TPA: hypothetical protein VGC97_24925 [Pyrinomonadaceae bacterium]|jgi:hypothetical protein